ncbi:MAG: hypothetical protein OXU98_05995 [Gammaproteobacteria bacterium]|nr:hypothetical protein [Gammaproteobacteria bacterium]
MKAAHFIDTDTVTYMRRLGQAARKSATMDRNAALVVLHLLVEFQSFPENTQQQV